MHNVTLLQGDAQVFAFTPAAFDVAASRMGVMFFADPVAAFRNIGGALRPGGRLVFACWAPLAENQHWLISYDIALRHLGPPPPSTAHEPGPLAFGNPDYIRRILAEAGFAAITVERAHPTITGGSPEEEARQALMMGPTARLIEAKAPDERTRQVIAEEIAAAFATAASAGPIRLPATIFLVTAAAVEGGETAPRKLRMSEGWHQPAWAGGPEPRALIHRPDASGAPHAMRPCRAARHPWRVSDATQSSLFAFVLIDGECVRRLCPPASAGLAS